jgi:hypothetical protein
MREGGLLHRDPGGGAELYGTPYEAIAVAEEAVVLANQMNNARWLGFVEYGLGQSYFLAGRFRDAERHLAKAISLLTSAPENVPPGTTDPAAGVLLMGALVHGGWNSSRRNVAPKKRVSWPKPTIAPMT